jgi:hypothetical protein
MAPVIGYFVQSHDFDAAIAFVGARSRIEPENPQLYYELAVLHAMANENDDALKYLSASFTLDPTNAVMAAKLDPSFAVLHNDPRFEQLINNPPTNAAPTNAPPAPAHSKGKLKKPAKKG